MNGEHLVMSQKERRRLQILARLKVKEITLSEAATLMHVSYRQARRIYKRYREQGDKGIIHQNRGRESNRRKPMWFRKKVLKLYQERYYDFGPTLAVEKLAEDGLELNRETLRLWLLDEGLWQPRKKRMKHRKRRKRKAHFGELIQLDGSHHRWFEKRGKKCNLMNLVDDATGVTLGMLSGAETVKSAMQALWLWIERYGIPHAVYTDRHKIYQPAYEVSIEEAWMGKEPQTQFSRACKELGIKVVYSHSPQAHGRVERSNGLHQDRLVKELRLKEIDTLESANEFLADGYLDNLNDKFAIEPASETDFHRPVPEDIDLASIFSIRSTRKVTNDWTIRWKNNLFQILNQTNLPPTKSEVEVREYLDGSVHLFYRGQEVSYQSVQSKPKKVEKVPRKYKSAAKDHPWRKDWNNNFSNRLTRKQLTIALGETYEDEEWMLPY